MQGEVVRGVPQARIWKRQSEYSRRIESVGDEKRSRYERVVLGELAAEDFKTEKISLDAELSRLTRIHDALADLLIDRVRVFPDRRIEADWRFADHFSGESV
jgi:hypothetical protein